jgi:hypothetical protein
MTVTLLPPNEFAAEALQAPFMATPGCIERFTRAEIDDAIMRHLHLDWNDMDEEDRAANLAAAMEGGGRVFGAYRIRAKANEPCDLWVITEADRSVTTALLPEEY